MLIKIFTRIFGGILLFLFLLSLPTLFISVGYASFIEVNTNGNPWLVLFFGVVFLLCSFLTLIYFSIIFYMLGIISEHLNIDSSTTIEVNDKEDR